MKIFKIILGIILGLAAISVLMEELSMGTGGAELSGVLTGFGLFMALSVWLIYSALKSGNSKDKESDK